MLVLSIFISTVYILLIIDLVRGFNRLPEFFPDDTTPQNKFSIIVPFRNEAKNLPVLLQSFSRLNYPIDKFEILMVNDDSSDDFHVVTDQFIAEYPDVQIAILNNQRNSDSPKKDAIKTAISKAKFEWILTTDADCEVPVNWLKIMDAFIDDHNVKMIVAPVVYKVENRFIQQFQNLDFLSLQGTTMGSFGLNKPFLCNGANLCYTKKAFQEVNGFEGNDNIASGDDVFLMEKMLRIFPKEVKYVKNFGAIVETISQPNLNSLIDQRVRWAAKIGSTNSIFGKLVGLTVFAANFYLILLLILALLQKISWQHIGLFYMVKLNVDFVLLFKTANFFKQQDSMRSYLMGSFIYPFFSVYIAFSSFFKGYQWKGRVFKK